MGNKQDYTLSASTDRLAWCSTKEQGMGSGLTVCNDRQPNQRTGRKLEKDYYIKSKGTK